MIATIPGGIADFSDNIALGRGLGSSETLPEDLCISNIPDPLGRVPFHGREGIGPGSGNDMAVGGLQGRFRDGDRDRLFGAGNCRQKDDSEQD